MGRPSREPVIAYVLRKFPVLSETFVLGELLALEERGVKLHVFSLERPNDPRFHDDLPRLKARVTYVPATTELKKLMAHNQRVSQSCPVGYRETLAYVASRARPKLLRRMLQAGYIANEIRRLKVTHVHAQFANRPTTVAHLVSRITGIPFSFTAHATDIFKTTVSEKALSHKVKASQFVVTVSEFNKRHLEKVCGGSAEKIVLIYNGIDLDRFAPNQQPSMTPFRFICVARLVEKKGLPVLVEAARLLSEQGLDFEIDLIGKGRLRSPLRDQIRAAGLKGRVHLVGPKTQLEVHEYFHRAHAAVLPAIVGADGNREGLPVSITEALACGLPVISTPVTGIPEAVEDGVNGLLVPPGDAPAFAKAMERLLSEPGLYPALRARARASVEGKFDRRQTAEHLVELFRRGTP